MKRGWVGAALFLIFSLVACGERQEVAVESTAVPTPLPTIEPTVTETAVPAPATVGEETAVPTYTITLTLTPLPTITPTPERFVRFETGPEGQPYPAVPITDVDPANYQITKPDAAILFQILLLTMQETCNYGRDYQNLPEYAYTYSDLFRMLAYDADKFTDEEWENAIWLIQDAGNCLGEGFSFFVPEIIPQALQVGMVEFLNQNEIKFDPMVQTMPEVNFRAIPIDYDPEFSEWLVEAIFIRYDLRILVPIFEDDFGVYHLIPNDFTPQLIRSLFSRELKTNIDLTGDGVDEIIVVTRIDGSTAGGYPGYIEIFSWSGSALSVLEILWIGDERSANSAFDTKYTIADFNNDSVSDIEVIKPHYDHDFPNCDWIERHRYSWQDSEVSPTIEFLEKPNRSECESPYLQYAGLPLIVDSTFLVDNFGFDVSSGYLFDESDENLRRLIQYAAPIVQQQILAKQDMAYLQEVLKRSLARMELEQSFYEPSHLIYLLGLSYELSGAEETAVATYLDLIQQFPTSPWSWLAWARLEPVEN